MEECVTIRMDEEPEDERTISREMVLAAAAGLGAIALLGGDD